MTTHKPTLIADNSGSSTGRVPKPFSLRYLKTIGIVNDVPLGRGFWNPVDLAVARDGRIYVQNRGPQPQSRVGVCNLAEDYLDEFGAYGAGDGELTLPTAIALDSRGRVYVSDELTHRINVFDSSGRFLEKWGEHGSAPGQLNGPAGLAFGASSDVYVSDQHNHRIQKFTADGDYVLGWGSQGNGNGQLNMPWGITVDGVGDVWVADWRNDRIQKFTPDGQFLTSYGESGHEDGQLYRPSSVAVDTDGNIYVADWGNERVQVLYPNGAHLLTLRGEAGVSLWAQEFFDSNPEEKRTRALADMNPPPDPGETPYELSSRSESLFWGPISVKLDGHGRLYVTETSRHRFQVYERK